MMKVLFMTNTPAPYRVDFFNELGKSCDLTVTYEEKLMTEREKDWYSQKAKNFKEIYLNGYSFKGRYIGAKVIKVLHDKFDFIIVGGSYNSPTNMIAILYMTIKKIPFYEIVDGGFIKEEPILIKAIKVFFRSKALGWFSTGEATDRYLIHYGAKQDRIYRYAFSSLSEDDIIKDPISDNEKEKIKNELNIRESLVIVTVGQFVERKGFDILLKSFSKINKDVGLFMIGGKPTDEYINLIESHNIKNVHFPGFLSKKELKKYYSAADLFVLPTRLDAWGLVIQEAMAQGLPVITTNKCLSGLELIRNNINGYIVEANNVDDLTSRINTILLNDKLLKDASYYNIKLMENYTIEKQVSSVLKVLTDLHTNKRKVIVRDEY